MAYGHWVSHGFHFYHKSRKSPFSSKPLLPPPKHVFMKHEKLWFGQNIMVFYILKRLHGSLISCPKHACCSFVKLMQMWMIIKIFLITVEQLHKINFNESLGVFPRLWGEGGCGLIMTCGNLINIPHYSTVFSYEWPISVMYCVLSMVKLNLSHEVTCHLPSNSAFHAQVPFRCTVLQSAWTSKYRAGLITSAPCTGGFQTFLWGLGGPSSQFPQRTPPFLHNFNFSFELGGVGSAYVPLPLPFHMPLD